MEKGIANTATRLLVRPSFLHFAYIPVFFVSFSFFKFHTNRSYCNNSRINSNMYSKKVKNFNKLADN